MAHVLGKQDDKVFSITGDDGEVYQLFWRQPTTKELNAFTNKQIVRKGKKVENQTGQARLKYGADICTGIRKGDYVIPVGDGHKVISSDPKDADYHPNWKGLLKQFAAKHLHALASHVFEPSAEADGIDENDDILDEDEILADESIEDDPEKNSPSTSKP